MSPFAGRRSRIRRWAWWVGVAGILLQSCTFTDQPPSDVDDSRSVVAGNRPNVVLIVTDDQRWDTLDSMPATRRMLVEPGMTFRNAFVVNPLCCPSRASILTGGYSHTTGVYTNGGKHGPRAFDDASTLATWLDAAGYRTGLVGKWMNTYADLSYVPPGWDRWVGMRASHAPYYGYSLSIDGEPRTYGSRSSDYSTDVLAGFADRFVRSTDDATPLFLMITTSAPHGPSLAAPRHEGVVDDGDTVTAPSVAETDVSDKPRYIRTLPAESPQLRAAQGWHDRQVASLRAVDDLVRRVVQALRATDRLHDTLLVFTSDNGIAFGEHRWTYKLTPYEESIRVPLVIRYDPETSGTDNSALALNIDLAPTIGDLTRVPVPGTDGESLLPLLDGSEGGVRDSFLLEHLRSDRAGDRPDPPTYCGLRTKLALFVRYRTGEEEFYDLRHDPYQLENLAADARWQRRVRDLRGRTRAMCRPVPPGFSWTE
jgi:N-acetylglucosamine-6-sulfatase